MKKNLYTTYLTTTMHESELVIQMDKLQVKSVKSGGVVYTPWYVVEAMVSLANPTPDKTIVEPSCGHAIFLFGLLHFMKEKHGLVGQQLLDWFLSKVHGSDISDNTIIEARELLSLFFKKHCMLDVEPDAFTNIQCADGLMSPSTNRWDLGIGNPPWIRTKNLEETYLNSIRKSYSSCKKGNVDIYYAFTEKYVSQCDELCFIIPNSFLTNVSGKTLKELVIRKLNVLIDFKEKQIFEGIGAYSCIIKTSAATSDTISYGNDLTSERKSILKQTLTDVNSTNGLLGDTPVLSGIATLCDKVFLVKKKNNRFYASFNGNDYEVENDIVVPYLKLTKLSSNVPSNFDYMIYPYTDKTKTTIIDENTMKLKFPLAYAYLLTVKPILDNRDKGKVSGYDSWYAYGRRQGLHKITSNTILTIPQMIGGVCKPRRIDVSNILTSYSTFVFTSGFVVQETNKNKQICDAILSSKFIDFAKNNGKPWPGKDESYYSLTTKQIKKFNPNG